MTRSRPSPQIWNFHTFFTGSLNSLYCFNWQDQVSRLLYLPFGPRDIPPSIPSLGTVMKYIGQSATLRNRTPNTPEIGLCI